MKMIACLKSSTVRAHGYSEPNKHVAITFSNGATYDYWNVEAEDYKAMTDAESFGSHLNRVFKIKYRGQKREENATCESK